MNTIDIYTWKINLADFETYEGIHIIGEKELKTETINYSDFVQTETDLYIEHPIDYSVIWRISKKLGYTPVLCFPSRGDDARRIIRCKTIEDVILIKLCLEDLVNV